MKRRIIAGILSILLLFGMASCGRGDMTPKEETTPDVATKGKPVASPIDGDPEKAVYFEAYTAEFLPLGLSEDELLLDVQQDGDGFRTIVAKSVELAEDYAEGYMGFATTPHATEYRYLDATFTEDKARRADTVLPVEMTSFASEKDTYCFGGDYSHKSHDPNEAIERVNGVDYRLYQNGEVYITMEKRIPGDYIAEYAQLLLVNEGLYSVVCPVSDEMRTLFVNGSQLYRMDSPEAPSFYPVGVAEIGGQAYAVIHATKIRNDNGEITVEWDHGVMVPISAESKELGYEGIALEGTPDGAVGSDGTYCYYTIGGKLWRTDGESCEMICDLVTVGYKNTQKIRQLLCLEDGRIIAITTTGIFLLTQGKASETKSTGIYTIGTYMESVSESIEFFVANYNRANRGYAFAVKQYDSISDMNLALLSGEISLIVGNDVLALRNYADKGYLADMEEAVPDLFTEEILTKRAVEATRWNGKVYFLPRNYHIDELLTVADRVWEGDELPATLQEWFALLEAKAPYVQKGTLKKNLYAKFAPQLEEWIDWETNSCNYTDGKYETMLEYCNGGAKDPDELEMNWNSPDFPEFPDIRAEDYLHSLTGFGSNAAMKAYPDLYDPNYDTPMSQYALPEGEYSGYALDAWHYFGIANSKTTMEAAKDFIWYCYAEDVVKEFPENEDDAYREISWYGSGYSINREENERYLRSSRYTDIEKLMDIAVRTTQEMIDRIDHISYGTQNVIYEVMYEEAARYFAGDITAKQAAEYTQNRVSIYLAEQG